jgi:hypothetical protein
MMVLSPDLKKLANGRTLPHVYSSRGTGTQLCLWQPRYEEWDWSMKLTQTYVPWSVEWLFYYEHWLDTNEWLGGGEHPVLRRRQCPSR